MGRVRAVLFDFDNTLYDDAYARQESDRVLRRRVPQFRRVPLGELIRLDEQFLAATHVELVMTGRMTVEASRIVRMQRLSAAVGVPIGRAEAHRINRIRTRAYFEHERAVPGSLALLRALRARGIHIAVVTDHLRSEQEKKIAALGLAPLLDSLTTWEEAGASKPDPRIFRLALQRCGGKPGDVVMVGDSWERDVEGARGLGIRAVWFDHDSGGPRPTPRHPPPRVARLSSWFPTSRALRAILGPEAVTGGFSGSSARRRRPRSRHRPAARRGSAGSRSSRGRTGRPRRRSRTRPPRRRG